MKNNRGLSLIELVVAIAAMGIVTAAVVGFLHVSLRTYSSTNRDIDLQYEAQLVTNQIKDLVIDSNRAIKCTEETDASGVSARTLHIYNQVSSSEGTIAEIRWERDKKQVFYTQYKYDIVNDTTDTVNPLVNKSLMADYVTDFIVDLTGLSSNKVVFTLTYEVQDKKYTGKSTITLRNDIRQLAAGEDEGDAFDGVSDFTGSTITGVTVTPGTATVRTGEEYGFTAKVDGMNSPSQDVVWSIEGALGSTTIDASGSLKVGSDETAGTIKVIAKSRYNSQKSGEAIVTIDASPKITGITIEKDSDYVERGGTANFTANVTGETGADTSVVWTISGDGAGSASISSSGVLTVGSDTTASSLTVTATSKADNSKTATTTIRVTQIKKITISGEGTLKQGSTGNYTAKVSSTTASTESGVTDVTWSVVTSSNYDVRISQDGSLYIGVSVPAGATIELKATSKYDSSVSGTKTITVAERGKISGFTIEGVEQITEPAPGYFWWTATTTSTTYSVDITSSDGVVTDAMKEVTWTVTGLRNGITFDATTGTLTVSSDANVGKNGVTVTITATSIYDNSWSDSIDVVITE